MRGEYRFRARKTRQGQQALAGLASRFHRIAAAAADQRRILPDRRRFAAGWQRRRRGGVVHFPGDCALPGDNPRTLGPRPPARKTGRTRRPTRHRKANRCSRAGRQPINYSDPRMDEYLLGARNAATFDERVEFYRKAQRLNLEDPGFLILMTPYNFTAIGPRVRNWLPSASYGSVTRYGDEIWIDG